MRRWDLGAAACALALTTAVVSALVPASAADDERERALVELGRRLFFDPTVSRRGNVSCAACHDPEHGFADSRDLTDDDRGGPVTSSSSRASPLVDLGEGPFGRDGSFDTLRDAIDDHLLEPRAAREAAIDRATRRFERSMKAGLDVLTGMLAWMPYELDEVGGARGRVSSRSRDDATRITPIENRLAEDGRYDAAFSEAFGATNITRDRIGDALAAYVGTLRSAESPFDRYRAGDENALPEAARRGLALFTGRAKCSQCHVISEGRATFTDGDFHDVGVEALPDSRGATSPPDGRMRMSFVRADRGKFRTPSLRGVARRGPWFHDGSAASLDDVVRHYGRGGIPHAELDPRITALALTETEVGELVAFLGALTGDTRAGVASRGKPPRLTLHVETLLGAPFAQHTVVVQPAGDGFGGDREFPPRFEVMTDAGGNVSFEFPASTHVELSADGFELGVSRLVPDCAISATLVATPLDRISIRLRWIAGAAFPDAISLAPPRSPAARAPDFSSGASGRVCADATDMPHEARFVRWLAANEAIYSMPQPGFGGSEPVLLDVVPFGTDGLPQRREFDFRGGASETIDAEHSEPLDRGRIDRNSPAMLRLEAASDAAAAAREK